MSVNYYMALPDGTPDESRHLGQFAAGRFLARAYPERGIVDRASWMAQLDGGKIVNEYCREVSREEMEKTAVRRSRFEPSTDYKKDEWHDGWMRFCSREFF